QELLLSQPRFSIVRSVELKTEGNLSPLSSPLRLMSVMPNPPEAIRSTLESSAKALDALQATEKIRYHPLLRGEATLSNLTQTIRSFGPQILHCEIYISDSPNEQDLRVYLSRDNSGSQVIGLEEFGKLLTNAGIKLVIIGRNQVSSVFMNPALKIAST